MRGRVRGGLAFPTFSPVGPSRRRGAPPASPPPRHVADGVEPCENRRAACGGCVVWTENDLKHTVGLAAGAVS